MFGRTLCGVPPRYFDVSQKKNQPAISLISAGFSPLSDTMILDAATCGILNSLASAGNRGKGTLFGLLDENADRYGRAIAEKMGLSPLIQNNTISCDP